MLWVSQKGFHQYIFQRFWILGTSLNCLSYKQNNLKKLPSGMVQQFIHHMTGHMEQWKATIADRYCYWPFKLTIGKKKKIYIYTVYKRLIVKPYVLYRVYQPNQYFIFMSLWRAKLIYASGHRQQQQNQYREVKIFFSSIFVFKKQKRLYPIIQLTSMLHWSEYIIHSISYLQIFCSFDTEKITHICFL